MPARSDIEKALFRERLRLGVVLAVFLGSLLYLGASLYQVQVRDSAMHTTAFDKHSIRRVRLPARRGRILDRQGVPLAESDPSYSLGIFVEELRRPGHFSNTVNAVEALVGELAEAIGRPGSGLTRKEIQRHIHLRRPLALTAFRDLSDREIARFLESPHPFPGVDIQIQPMRVYPYGDSAAHVIGYVRKRHPPKDKEDDEAESESEEETFDYYLPDLVGSSGIEQALDETLAGKPGGELVRIDAIGYKHSVSASLAPVAGEDVTLSLDIALQQRAERALGDRCGAAVIMDVRTGELLVLASSPRYDLSRFSPILSSAYWREISDNPGRPLLNRAAMGIYPPGSTVKPFVALSALDAGSTTANRTIHCGGAFRLGGGFKLRCGHRLGHGSIDLETAIEQSCNVYFCQLGVDLGYEPTLYRSYQSLGFGTRPACEIPVAAGVLPSAEWKRRTRKDSWRGGDTANISIGQGYLCVTPLQLAMGVAAIANGGDLLAPRLVLDGSGRRVIRHIPWKKSSLAAVREGMHRVIEAPHGGGRRAHVAGLDLAGKTGTAEYGSEGKKHTWMVAYGPYKNPEYAMVVLVENGESGGKTVAPIVHELFSALYGVEAEAVHTDHSEYVELPVLPPPELAPTPAPDLEPDPEVAPIPEPEEVEP